MMNSTTQAMLTGTMGFAWRLIATGERVVAFAESGELHEGNEQSAGFVELTVWRAGRAIVVTSERLELRVNALALRLGYSV
jgi:hypothetical protein